jgi:hypothetical protein
MDQSLRSLVRERARDACEYCRLPQAYDDLPFEIDHVIAEKHDGGTVPENLALTCYFCNSFKGPNIAGLDPETRELTRLFHPRTDIWPAHFQWQGPRLIGLTPVGRTTIQVLRMNHPARLALRLALKSEGVFPPSER